MVPPLPESDGKSRHTTGTPLSNAGHAAVRPRNQLMINHHSSTGNSRTISTFQFLRRPLLIHGAGKGKFTPYR
jgi:hypothetical protein